MADNDVQSNVVLTADTSQYNQAITGSAQQTDAFAASIDSLGAKLDKLSKSAGKKLLGVSAADTAVIVGATAAYASWEKQMTSLNVQAAVLNRTMNDQKRTFDEYGRQVNSLRRDFGQSTTEAAQLVQTISKMADQTAPVTQLERSFGKLGTAMGESSSSLAASMLQLQRTMGTSQRDTNMFNNQLTVLQSRSNAAASSILGFANSIAPVARVANISQTDIMGMSNAFIKAGQDGYQAANVVTRMLTDITQATVSGSPELAKYANLVGMTTQQFKELGGTGQITQIFDAINRQGPQAITTLNRMGLDGLRTVRTITAMAQQGGLGAEIEAARSADPNAMNRGSSAAMSGISDSMKKLRIELQQTAESFGSVFAKPAKMFFDSMTMIAKAVHAVVDSPIGKMAAIVMGVAAPFAALAGTVLMAAKALTAFAAVNQVVRGSMAYGIREGRGIPMAEQQAMLAGGTALGPQGRIIAERGSWSNRMFYNAGRQFGSFLPERGPGPGLMSRGAGAIMGGTGGLARLTGTMLYGAGAVRIPGIDNSGGYNDVTRRPNFFRSPTVAGSFEGPMRMWNSVRAGFTGSVLGRMPSEAGTEEDVQRRMTRMAGSRLSGLSTDAERRTMAERESQAFARSTSALSNFERSTQGASRGAMVLGRGMGNLSMMMAGTATGALRTGGSLIGRGIGAIGMNPWMLGIMGGVAGMSALAAMNRRSNNVEILNTAGFNNPYYQAGGVSAPPTANISYARQRPVANNVGTAMRVSADDVTYAQSQSHKLTNSNLKGLSSDEALSRLAVQWQTLRQSPEAINAVKLDLIDKFGPAVADQMLAKLDAGATPGIAGLAGKAGRAGGAMLGVWGSTKPSSRAMDQFYGGLSDLADVTYQTSGPQAAAQAKGRALAEGYAAFAAGNQNGPQMKSFEKEFNKNVLGLNNVNYLGSDGFLGGLGDYGGTQFQAGKASDLKGFLTDLATKGSLSNDENRKQVAERYGIDYKGMSDRQFATALYNVIKNGPDYQKWEATQETTQDLLKKSSAGLFGVAGVLGNRTVQNALQNTGDVNAQYAAANEIQQRIAAGGGGTRRQFGAIERLISGAGGDASMGADLFRGAYGQMVREQGFRQPYMTRTQSFGQQTGMFQAAMNAPISAGWTAQDRQNAQDQFAGQVQEQYNYFKQLLYQQREFNISRSRAEEDFNLQRSYALTDFNLQRGRAEHDFQLQRQRAEADYALAVRRNRQQFDLQREREDKDHQHQVMLMVEQQAKAMYNMYERVHVQRTNSARWLLVNSEDQLQRMQKQERQLNQLRGMGLSDDAIQQLNLTDSSNQQQLSRFVTEVAADPTLVKSFNAAVKTRLKAARELVTDESSTDWQEFQRSFNLARSRAADDFERQMKQSRQDFKKSLARQDEDFHTSMGRQQHDFAVSMDRQREQYNTTMQRAAADLARSAQTIDGNFAEILTKATKKLGGHAAKQAQTVLDQFNALKKSTSGASVDIMTTLAAIFGLDWTPPKPRDISNQAAKNRAEIMDVHQAAGGVLPGYTPGRDVHHFYSPTAGNLHLSGGEAVMVPEWTKAVGGPQAVERMNRAARQSGGKRFASGGTFWPVPGHEVSTYPGHDGIDINRGSGWDDYGDPIRAARGGRVSYVGTGHGYGDAIFITGPYGTVVYGHTSMQAVHSGENVAGGQFIGRVGSTGHSSAPHLHFGFPGGTSAQAAAFLRGAQVSGGMLSGLASAGAAAVQGASFASAVKAIYPKVEAAAADIVPHIFEPGMASNMVNRLARKRYRQLRRAGGGAPGSTGSGPGGPGPLSEPAGDHTPQGLVRLAGNQHGWGDQWPALYQLVMHESGFRPTAQNPTSTAYGMFQFLDSTWGSVGGHKTSDPWLQAVYGTKYISQRYGNPNKAWDFWQNHHWYGDGAVFSGAQTIGVGERGPEAVIPLNDRGADFMGSLMSKYGSGNAGRAVNVRGSTPIYISNSNTYHIDRSTTFSGPISVSAENPGQLIAALQQRQRMMAMANPAIGGVKV